MAVRVLVVSMNYKPELTGIGKYSSEMSEWLVSKGCKVVAITAPPYYPNWEIENGYVSYKYKSEDISGVKVIRCPIWIPKSVSFIKRIIHLLVFALSSMPVIIWNSIKYKPELIFVVEPPIFAILSCIVSSKISKSTLWLHVQDLEMDAAFELGMIRNKLIKTIIFKFESLLYNNVHVISTISQQMMSKLKEKKITKVRKQLIFKNWVNLQVIHPIDSNTFRINHSISDEKIVFLYSGNMGKKQGLEDVIDAAKVLSNKRSDLLFIMCGNGVVKKEMVKRSEGCSSILFIPLQPLNQLNSMLNAADVHLLPQREGADGLVMPSKLSNMLASGKPVIATVNDDSEIAKILLDAGVISKPGDLTGLIKSIELLANSRNLRVDMGRKARQIAESNFNSEVILNSVFKDFI